MADSREPPEKFAGNSKVESNGWEQKMKPVSKKEVSGQETIKSEEKSRKRRIYAKMEEREQKEDVVIDGFYCYHRACMSDTMSWRERDRETETERQRQRQREKRQRETETETERREREGEGDGEGEKEGDKQTDK